MMRGTPRRGVLPGPAGSLSAPSPSPGPQVSPAHRALAAHPDGAGHLLQLLRIHLRGCMHGRGSVTHGIHNEQVGSPAPSAIHCSPIWVSMVVPPWQAEAKMGGTWMAFACRAPGPVQATMFQARRPCRAGQPAWVDALPPPKTPTNVYTLTSCCWDPATYLAGPSLPPSAIHPTPAARPAAPRLFALRQQGWGTTSLGGDPAHPASRTLAVDPGSRHFSATLL